MSVIDLTTNEFKVIRDLTKPSTYKRLYKNLDKLTKTDAEINDYLAKSNYSKITDIYITKNNIKESIIKNQLSLLMLYQQIITTKPNGQLRIFQLQDSLIPLLIETLTFRLLKIDSLNRKQEKKDYSEEVRIIESILNKISKVIDANTLYFVDKKINSNLNIVEFFNLHDNLGKNDE